MKFGLNCPVGLAFPLRRGLGHVPGPGRRRGGRGVHGGKLKLRNVLPKWAFIKFGMLCAYVMSTVIVYSLDIVRPAAVDNLMPYSVFNYWGRLLIWRNRTLLPLLRRCPTAAASPTLEIALISRYLSVRKVCLN